MRVAQLFYSRPDLSVRQLRASWKQTVFSTGIEVAEDKSGRMGVKVLDIDREIVIGFDQAHMKKRMGL